MAVAEIHHSAHKPPRAVRLGRAMTGPVILFLLTCGFYWKLVLSDQYTYLESPDLAYQVLPWFQFQAGEWHEGRFPLWDPYHWNGQPVVGQAQPGAVYPLNWLLFASPLNSGWLRQSHLHWYFVLIHYLAAVFCYLLARDLGRSRTAAVIAGCAFAFGGVVGTNDWPQMLNGAIWIPLVFLFLLRAIRDERAVTSAVWSGVFLGVSWLSGHHQIPIFTSLVAVGVWMWHVMEGKRLDWHRIHLAGLFCLFTFLAGAAQTLPAYEYGKLASRWVGLDGPIDWNQKVPYQIHTMYSMPPVTLFGLVLPGMHMYAKPFMGIAAVCLAGIGVAAAWRYAAGRVLAGVAAGGLALSLGGYLGLHGLLYSLLPFVDKARTPSMAFVLVNFALATLAAYGVDELLHGRDLLAFHRAALVTGAFGTVVLVTLCVFAMAGKAATDERYVLSGLFALASAAIVRWRSSLTPAGLSGLLLLIVFSELSMVGTYEFPNRFDKKHTERRLDLLASHGEIAQFLQQRRPPIRVSVDQSEIPYNLGDWFGIDQIDGYLASVSTNLISLEIHTPRFQRLFGVNYRIGKNPSSTDQVEVFTAKNGLKVFRDDHALPRARTVHAVESVPDHDALRRAINSPDRDIVSRPPLIGETPALSECAIPDNLRIEQLLPGQVRIEALMGCTGMLVLADTAFPGWRATVNGRPARIYEPYGAMRGVELPAGKHIVEMHYQPISVMLGAALSLIGIFAACVLELTIRGRFGHT